MLFDAAEAVGRSLGLAYVGIELADEAAPRYEWGSTTAETTVIALQLRRSCRWAGCAPPRAVVAR